MKRGFDGGLGQFWGSPLTLGFHGKVFWVYEGKALKLVLVEVHDDLLVWRGENRWMAGEKAVKVLCIPATLQEGEKNKRGM